MAATIGTSHAAAQTKWLNELFLRHLNNNSFAPLMGSDAESVIRLMNVDNKAGDTFKVHFSDFIADSEWVSGDTALTGIAETLATDSVTIDRQRVARKIENFAMSQQRTIVDMEREMVMPKLEAAMKSKVQSMILTALLDKAAGRSQARYLYGGIEANYNATHATAAANVDATNDKLTLAMIERAARKAKLSGAGVGKIKPAKVKLLDGRYNEYEYVLLAHSNAVRDLKSDSNFANRITYRESQQFNVIDGATFVGKHEGVLIYEMMDSGMIETGAGASSIDIAHNVLLGAGAAVMAYGNVQVPAGSSNYIIQSKNKALVTSEVSDHAGNVTYGLTFVGGAKKLVNSSSEDNAVVHLFTAAVADA